MRTTKEILRNARILQLEDYFPESKTLTGYYRSAFKGLGMQFKEVRQYEAGDDIRFIDWNVSARMGHGYLYSKVFEEEKELTVYILADVSASKLFGTTQLKCDALTQLCADLVLTSIKKNNTRTGLVLFNDTIENYIRPQKTLGHMEFMIETLTGSFARSSKTNIGKALQFLGSTIKQPGMVFILSDFVDDYDYKEQLFTIARRNTVFGFRLFDNRDFNLPIAGLLQLEDLETGKPIMIDSTDTTSRQVYARQYDQYTDKAMSSFEFAGAALLSVETNPEMLYLINKNKN